MDGRRCGWRRSVHHVRRRLDLALVWWWGYDSDAERLIWFDTVTQLWGPGHWMCDCGELERRRERHWRLMDKMRERLIEKLREQARVR